MEKILFLQILVPFIFGVIILTGSKVGGMKPFLTIIATAINLLISGYLLGKDAFISLPWAGFGMDFSLRLYTFSALMVFAVAVSAFFVSFFSAGFMKGKENQNQFYSYFLITLAFSNGAILANNLMLLLFFWEGILLTLFGMIAIGKKEAYKAATKAFVIVGVTDICMMAGIAIVGKTAGTFEIAKTVMPLDAMGSMAMILLLVGALGKIGSMPFHTWIPDAADEAALPFMAYLPASVEKLLGVYLLVRISMDMFAFTGASWISGFLMIVGVITIVFAVLMAIVQKNFKRFLAYDSISQAGYMILGVGTCLPIGIVGAILHVFNNAIYKTCLFLSAGSVEKATGTTDISGLGGLVKKMPFTFFSFAFAGLALSGIPPFSGFFSKELIYDAALERGVVFYALAVIGSFFTVAAVLKFGHSVFFGKEEKRNEMVKESPVFMLLPMAVMAGIAFISGFFSQDLINCIMPVLGSRSEGQHISAIPENMVLVTVTAVVVLLALAHHLIFSQLNGSAKNVTDHIRNAFAAKNVYDLAEKKVFDPYDMSRGAFRAFANIAWGIDRAIDWIYDGLCVKIAGTASFFIRKAHTGSYGLYIAWAVGGAVVVMIFGLK